MKRQTVALCVLSRNNENIIGTCLKSCLAIADEIIVIDLDSSDSTLCIAEGYGANVYTHEFDQDYSQAKNIALEKAKSDWILWLNADEYLAPISPRDFREKISREDVGGFKIKVRSKKTGQLIPTSESIRLFRKHHQAKFEYPVREKIEPSLRRLGAKIVKVDDLVIVRDDEYINMANPSSTEAIRILIKATVENPNDPYLNYALACEYISEHEGDIIPSTTIENIIQRLSKAISQVFSLSTEQRQHLVYMPDLMVKLSACHLTNNDSKSAIQTIRTAKGLFPLDQKILLQYVAASISYLRDYIHDNRSIEAQNIYRKIVYAINQLRDTDFEPAMLARYRGELSLYMGDVDQAQYFFEIALDIDSDCSYALVGLAQCQMLLGNKSEAIKFYILATRKNEHNYTAWLHGSNLLKEFGFTDNASTWRHRATMNKPSLSLKSRKGK